MSITARYAKRISSTRIEDIVKDLTDLIEELIVAMRGLDLTGIDQDRITKATSTFTRECCQTAVKWLIIRQNLPLHVTELLRTHEISNNAGLCLPLGELQDLAKRLESSGGEAREEEEEVIKAIRSGQAVPYHPRNSQFGNRGNYSDRSNNGYGSGQQYSSGNQWNDNRATGKPTRLSFSQKIRELTKGKCMRCDNKTRTEYHPTNKCMVNAKCNN